MSKIVEASAVLNSSFHSANKYLMQYYSYGIRWVSTFIVYAANRYTSLQLIAFLGFLFGILYLLNRNWRDENDRLMEDIERDLDDIERELDDIKEERRKEDGKDEEEEPSPPQKKNAGNAGLRNRKKKKKKPTTATMLTLVALICILTPANTFTVTTPALRTRPGLNSNLKRDRSLGRSALTAISIDDVTNAFFPLSLPPYLLFLREASLPIPSTTDSSTVSIFPPTVVASFRFLLIFVVLSIPSAILSTALLSGHSLSSCDFLHGSAESLLAVTNLLIVLSLTTMAAGKSLPAQVGEDSKITGVWWKGGEAQPQSTIATVAIAAFAVCASLPFLSSFPELPPLHTSYLTLTESASPLLSPQTWLVHSSSLLEWLYSMALIYSLSPTVKIANNSHPTKLHAPIVYSMITLHTSGVAACVYHLFGNSFDWIVALQGGLTFFGNCGLFLATKQVKERIENGYEVVAVGADLETSKGGEIAKTAAGSLLAAGLALLLTDQLTDVGQIGELAAFTLIAGAAAANFKKWKDREALLGGGGGGGGGGGSGGGGSMRPEDVLADGTESLSTGRYEHRKGTTSAFFLNAEKVVAGGRDAVECEAMLRAQLHGIDEWSRDLFVWSERGPAARGTQLRAIVGDELRTLAYGEVDKAALEAAGGFTGSHFLPDGVNFGCLGGAADDPLLQEHLERQRGVRKGTFGAFCENYRIGKRANGDAPKAISTMREYLPDIMQLNYFSWWDCRDAWAQALVDEAKGKKIMKPS